MGGVTYTYDDNGNLLSDGVNTYTYDTANRLISVLGPSSSVTYAYNGLGDRLQETVNGVTTTFTMDLNTGLTQALSDGTHEYLYGAGRIAQLDTGTLDTEYYLTDALGSVRQLTDSTGAVTLARTYDPYGKVKTTSGSSSSSYGFTAEYQSGLIIDSLHGENFAISFGKEMSGVARWGLFRVLQDAKDFDRISLYSLDFASTELFYPFKTYPGGDWTVMSVNCELYFFQPRSGKASIGISEFIGTINKRAEMNVGASDMGRWRPATLQYHWYRMNDEFYGDFYDGSHMPDFYLISAGFKVIGGAALGYIHDRYGNQYYSIGGGGALGNNVAEKWKAMRHLFIHWNDALKIYHQRIV